VNDKILNEQMKKRENKKVINKFIHEFQSRGGLRVDFIEY